MKTRLTPKLATAFPPAPAFSPLSGYGVGALYLRNFLRVVECGKLPRRRDITLSDSRAGGELLLPGAPRAAGIPSVARWVRPRSIRVMSGREALDYAARASASLSLALMGFEPLTGYSA